MAGGWYRILDGLSRVISFGYWRTDYTYQHCLRILYQEGVERGDIDDSAVGGQ